MKLLFFLTKLHGSFLVNSIVHSFPIITSVAFTIAITLSFFLISRDSTASVVITAVMVAGYIWIFTFDTRSPFSISSTFPFI